MRQQPDHYLGYKCNDVDDKEEDSPIQAMAIRNCEIPDFATRNASEKEHEKLCRVGNYGKNYKSVGRGGYKTACASWYKDSDILEKDVCFDQELQNVVNAPGTIVQLQLLLVVFSKVKVRGTAELNDRTYKYMSHILFHSHIPLVYSHW